MRRLHVPGYADASGGTSGHKGCERAGLEKAISSAGARPGTGMRKHEDDTSMKTSHAASGTMSMSGAEAGDPPALSPMTAADTMPVGAPVIDAIVFDLGGVLVDWNPRHLYRKMFTSEQEMEDFLAKVCTTAWNEQQDRGRPWAEAVRLLQAQHPAYWNEIAAYDTRWEEMLRGELPETVALLEALRDRPVRLLALTNWSQEKFPVARRRFAFLQHFEGILVSGEERLAKPEPEIFRLMASRYRLEPARTVFIDDSERNVLAARALGWHAIHFTGADLLRRHLKRLQLL